MTAIETTQGTDAAGLRFVAYGSPGCWSAIAAEDTTGSWRLWLAPPDKGEPPRLLWERGRWSEGYAQGVAEHIARALALVQAAAQGDAER